MGGDQGALMRKEETGGNENDDVYCNVLST